MANKQKGTKTKAKQKKAASPEKIQKQGPQTRSKTGNKKVEGKACTDDLGKTLATMGLRIRKVLADGNCFFRACCDQMQGGESGHLGLRKEVVGFMRQHADDFAPYMEDDEDFTVYCKRMERDGAWAGQQEQVAVTRLKGVQLRIYQAGQPCWTIHPDFPEIPKGAPSWHLSYHDGEHYNSVRLAEDLGGDIPLPIVFSEDGRTTRPVRGPESLQQSPEKWSRWSEQQLSEVCLGTGCDSGSVINQALLDANGSVDQAIELVIERMRDGNDSGSHPAAVSHRCNEGAAAANPDSSEEAAVRANEPADRAELPQQAATEILEPNSMGIDGTNISVRQPVTHGMRTRQSLDASSRPANEVNNKDSNSFSALKIAGDQDDLRSIEERSSGKKDKERGPFRNRPCPCGSGRKYRDCCLAAQRAVTRRQTQMEHARESGNEGSSIPMRVIYV